MNLMARCERMTKVPARVDRSGEVLVQKPRFEMWEGGIIDVS